MATEVCLLSRFSSTGPRGTDIGSVAMAGIWTGAMRGHTVKPSYVVGSKTLFPPPPPLVIHLCT